MKISVKKINGYLSKCAKGPKTSFSIYWHGYGGFRELLNSLYFWLALALSLVVTTINCYFAFEYWEWSDDVINIIPSVLGFSLGGYAFIVGFGNEKFMEVMRTKDNKNDISLYMKVNSSFLHFILIQFLSIFFTVLFKALSITKIFIFDFIGIFFFFYSLFTIVSTSFCVLNLSDWFDSMKNPDDESK